MSSKLVIAEKSMSSKLVIAEKSMSSKLVNAGKRVNVRFRCSLAFRGRTAMSNCNHVIYLF